MSGPQRAGRPQLLLLRLLAVAGVGLMALGRSRRWLAAWDEIRPTPSRWRCSIRSRPAPRRRRPQRRPDAGAADGRPGLGRRGRPVAGIVLCALAAAVKVPAALGHPLHRVGLDGRPALPWRARVRPVVTRRADRGRVMGALSVVTGLGWSWVSNLATPGTVRSWVAPATGAGIFLTDLAHLVGIGVPLHVHAVVHPLARARDRALSSACGCCCDPTVRDAARHGPHHADHGGARPVVQPWYLSWGLVVLAPVANGQGAHPHRGVVVVARLHRPSRRPLAGVGLFHGQPPHGGGWRCSCAWPS